MIPSPLARRPVLRRAPGWGLGLVVAVLLGAVPAAAEERPTGAVRWEAEAESAGRFVAERWPAVVADVQHRLGLAPPLEGVEVVVVRGLERLRAQARAAVPAWAAAVTVSGTRIVLRADVPDTARATLEETLRHEAVHLIWARAASSTGARLPRWFEEGLAEAVGGGVSVSAGARFEVAAGLGALLPFDQLEERFPEGPQQADLAYQQSRRWVEYLVGRAGWPAVRDVLGRVREAGRRAEPAGALSSALREATLHDLGEWHADWQLTLRERQSRWWLWLVTDVGGVVLALLALLAALSFARLRRQRRRQVEALPDDEPGGGGPDAASPVGEGRSASGTLSGTVSRAQGEEVGEAGLMGEVGGGEDRGGR